MNKAKIICHMDMDSLLNAAQELNGLMHLDPQICESKRTRLIEKLYIASSLLEPGDKISWETGKTLSALRASHRAEVEKRGG